MGVGQSQQQLEKALLIQQRSRQSLAAVQQAVKRAIDSHLEVAEQEDLDDFVDCLLSEDSDDFLTSFAQSSGE